MNAFINNIHRDFHDGFVIVTEKKIGNDRQRVYIILFPQRVLNNFIGSIHEYAVNFIDHLYFYSRFQLTTGTLIRKLNKVYTVVRNGIVEREVHALQFIFGL